MKLREEHWLSQRLQAWKDAGLLSAEQQAGIQAFEAEQGKRLKVDPIWILAAFAGLCVILGVGLVVAHNWDRIPPWWRQACYLAGIGAVAAGYYRWQERGVLGNGLAVAWLIAPMVGIGLWAQIYQLSGDPFKPFFITWLMGLPLVWMRRDAFLAVLHQILLGWGLFAGLSSGDSWVSLGARFWANGRMHEPEMGAGLLAGHLLLVLGLWTALLWTLRRLAGPAARLAGWAAFLLYLLFAGHTASLLCSGTALVTLGSILAVLAWSGSWAGVSAEALEGPAAWVGGLALYVQTFDFKHVDVDAWTRTVPAGQAYLFILMLVALGGLALAPLDRLGSKPSRAWALKLALALPAVLGILARADELLPLVLFLSNLGLAFTAAVWMFNGVARRHPKAVNRGVLFMSALVLTRFFDLFDSLLDSGLAFIAGGLGLGILAYGLEKGRRHLLGLAKEGRP